MDNKNDNTIRNGGFVGNTSGLCGLHKNEIVYNEQSEEEVAKMYADLSKMTKEEVKDSFAKALKSIDKNKE